MHIVIGAITALVSILYLLDRLGVDIGWLNPFHWRHRRAWARRHDSDPIYSVEDPIHVAAILVIGAAKLDGELSAGQKKASTEQFQASFSLDEGAASDLYVSATHLLGAPQIVGQQLQGLAERNKESFSVEQAESMMQMMVKVASADGSVSAAQQEYIDTMRGFFVAPRQADDGTWA
ncbi:MAG: TerB family tellurite resistance protein [Gammaproteobacteria bacterium]|nr:TerB family tellurite resistance protein [Gammaproteobacteria bacterium]